MMLLGCFLLFLLVFVAIFIGMLSGLMATLPGRARLLLTLSLAGAFVVLGWRSPNPVLARVVMTVCPTMVVLAWLFGTLRAGKPR